ncbi:PadR family transcriptional regulator [Oxyplasma meridianum]|uniref:PadR family transcriptional regulator n=1 Tax=Oxyplasma meridianum TaxID=3073602 RepID=A0AAX4NHF8_9ARCH
MGMGTEKRRGGLRYWILNLLYEKNLNGAKIMDEMEKQTMGWWRPSPGSVYPMLESMVEDGLITRLKDGKYDLTAKGKSTLETTGMRFGRTPRTVEGILGEISGFLSLLEDTVDSEIEKNERIRDQLEKLSERMLNLSRKF